jgi:serine/threonine-protein kinase
MGEVYRARDTKLDRDVAIKVLPEAFAADDERVARFQREARTLASLNHPNIAQIYGLEDIGPSALREPQGRPEQGRGAPSSGQPSRALVMELVEGDDLSQRIARGAMPLDEVLPIARQVADALEAAHDKGVIHRDLKPANIKVTQDGKVKVLDFGLAKMLEQESSASALSMSPTLSVHATYAGVILGTAAYMSPEQARGKAVDRRTDVWAFGCVLFEMLTGRPAFDPGETVSDAVASVLTREPDWNALPANTPAHVRTLIRRCLQKDPRKRLPHIGIARIEIDEGAIETQSPTIAGSPSSTQPFWKRAAPVLVVAILASAATSLMWWISKAAPPARNVTRLSFPLPEGQQFVTTVRRSIAISPDGSQIVYAANQQMYLRSMAEADIKPIPGTETTQGVFNPVFSPDGQSIAFWSLTGRAIKRIPVSGGATVTIAAVLNPPGMTWGPDGLVFADVNTIKRAPANGGTVEVLVTGKPGEQANDPQVLPGGTWVLFTVATGVASVAVKSQVVVQSLKTGERRTLVEGGFDPRYLPTGHLVYTVGGTVFARPFDITSLALTGGPVAVVDGVRRVELPNLQSHFAVSDTGTLIYLPGSVGTSVPQRGLALFDAKGGVETLRIPPAPYEFPRVSPDGKHIAVGTDDGKEMIVWIYDLAGTTSMRRLTFGGRNRFPVWSSDGQRVAFQSDRDGDPGIFWQRADGTGTAERLTRAEQGASHAPESWSPKSDQLLFSVTKEGKVSLWAFSLTDKKSTQFDAVQSSRPTTAAFSPDGRWVAYAATEPEQSRSAIYVQSFPATGTKFQLSDIDGHQPVWSHDGTRLFYIPGPDRFVAVSVVTQPTFTFGNPVPVPKRFIETGPVSPTTYDVLPDGQHVIGVVDAEQSLVGGQAPHIQVVLNWFTELQQRVPTR